MRDGQAHILNLLELAVANFICKLLELITNHILKKGECYHYKIIGEYYTLYKVMTSAQL